MSQKLKHEQELQVSFTKRINRPFFTQIILFIDSTDQVNWSKGNAALLPEFTNSMEFSYSKDFKKNNTFLASVYYKHSTNLITRFLDSVTTGSGTKRPLNTNINARSGYSTGLKLTSQNS